METGELRTTETDGFIRKGRGLWLALGALLIAGLLLATWMRTFAAPPSGNPPSDAPAVISCGTNCDYQITLSALPLKIGLVANAYKIDVSGTIFTTTPPSLAPIITDTLPNGILATNVTSGVDWNCNIVSSSTKVVCTYIAPLPNSGLIAPNPILISVNVLPSVLPNVTNTAQVTPTDVTPVDNTSSVLSAISFGYDFQLTKVDRASPMSVGTVSNAYRLSVQVHFTISATVPGPSIVDTLPFGMTPTSATGTNWTCTLNTTSTPKTVRCNYNLDVSRSKPLEPIDISIRVGTDVSPAPTNSATIQITDDNMGNNTASVVSTIQSADLQIKKTESPSPVQAGDTIQYTIVITNNGPTAAANTLVSDTFPTNLLTVTDRSLTSAWGGNASIVAGVLNWTIPSFPNNKSVASLVIPVTVKPASDGKLVTNAAVVSSDYPDWNLSNNRSSVSFPVGGLEILKKASVATANVGDPIIWSIYITNTSEIVVSSVVMSDTFSSFLDITDNPTRKAVNDGPNFGSISRSGNKVQFSASTFPACPSTTSKPKINHCPAIHITVATRGNQTITNVQTVNNQANLVWGSPRSSKSSGVISVVINPGPFLSVTKTNEPGNNVNVLRNQILTYTIKVQNIGSFPASNVAVTDTLSGPVTFLSYNLGGVTTVITGTNSSKLMHFWHLENPIIAGATVSIIVKAKVLSDAPFGDTVINTGCARSEDEASTVPHCAVVTNPVVAPAACASVNAIYSVAPAQAYVGGTFTFKIRVTNNSVLTINNVQVTETYPSAVDFQTVQTDHGTLTTNSSTKTFVVLVGSLDPAEIATITIILKVNTSVTTAATYASTASVSWNPICSRATNTLHFRVLPSSTLPGTGLAAAAAASTSLPSLALSVGLGLALLGIMVLFYSLLARSSRPLRAGGYARAGMVLLVLGLLVSAASWGLQSVQSEPSQLAALSGEKLLVATSIPPTATAHKVHRPTNTPAITNLDMYLPSPTPSVLPDYPVPTPTVKITPGPNGQEPDVSSIVRIVIPSIGLDTVVKYVPFDGHTWMIGGLKQEVAWMGNTSWPGLGSNTGLAGHVDLSDGSDGPFRHLDQLKPGDKVAVYTEQNRYNYIVREDVVVNDGDLSVVQPTDKPQLTLITCTLWDSDIRTYLKRLIVYSDLVTVQPENVK